MDPWVPIDEFAAYLIAAGILATFDPLDPDADLPLTDALAGAQSEFERRVGWTPFLCDPAPSDMIVDAEMYQSLDLVRATGTGAFNISAVSLSGTALPYGLNGSVFGYPQNANKQGFPVTTLKFFPGYYFGSGSWAGKQRLTVTAQWGRVLTLPADVKLALMQYGAGLLAPVVSYQRSGGGQKLREGDEEIDYGSSGGFGGGGAGSFPMMMTGAFDRAVLRWKRAGLA